MHDVYDEYTEKDGWRIRSDFQANLPRYINALLLKENIITSNVHNIVFCDMIPLLKTEIERLERKHGQTDNRISTLNATITFLEGIVTQDKTIYDCVSDISAHINQIYMTSSLGKYSSFEQIGIHLLNILMIVPLGIPGAIKYASTGSFFFSLNGKSQDLLNTKHQEYFSFSDR